MTITATDWTTAPSISEYGSHEHGLDTIVGYSVVFTSWPDSRMTSFRREQVAVYDGANTYGYALRSATVEQRAIEAARQQGKIERRWAVVDTLYGCGCRSDRVDG